MERTPFYGVEYDALYNARTGAHVAASSSLSSTQFCRDQQERDTFQDPLTFQIPCVLNYDPTLRVETRKAESSGSKRSLSTQKKKTENTENGAGCGPGKKAHQNEKENKKKVKGYQQQPQPVNKAGGNGTRIKMDLSKGPPPQTYAVEYGEELYMAAVKGVLEAKKEENVSIDSMQKARSIAELSAGCKDLSVPAFNSSVGRSSALSRAVDTFKVIPEEVEKMFRADRRFDPLLNAQASKALNVPLHNHVYRNLVPVDGVPEEVSKSVRSAISDAIHSTRPVPKPVDPTPNLLDYEKPTFSRIKPTGLLPASVMKPDEIIAPASPPTESDTHQLYNASITFLAMGERFF